MKRRRTDLFREKYLPHSRSQEGIALIMVLWVLTVMTVIALSFSYAARTETLAALSFKDTAERKFLAEAGVERGIMELFYRRQNINSQMSDIWKADGTLSTVTMENGYFTVRITDESGKVDINRAPEVILRNLFGHTGLDEDTLDVIMDSIMDWKDADDLHRLHGAESDYYMSLPNPYKSKDANFETPEELLFVKGMTPGILYGDEGKKGVIDFLTVNSRTDKINVNAAPREVLLAVPGISPEIADAVIESRTAVGTKDVQAILGSSYPHVSPFISSTDSSTYTIDAEGFKSGSEAGYGIRATVTILGNSAYKFTYYKTPVDMTYGSD